MAIVKKKYATKEYPYTFLKAAVSMIVMEARKDLFNECLLGNESDLPTILSLQNLELIFDGNKEFNFSNLASPPRHTYGEVTILGLEEALELHRDHHWITNQQERYCHGLASQYKYLLCSILFLLLPNSNSFFA